MTRNDMRRGDRGTLPATEVPAPQTKGESAAHPLARLSPALLSFLRAPYSVDTPEHRAYLWSLVQ